MPLFGRPYFYHQTIRKYTTLFGSMFAELTVARANTSQQTVQSLAVPLSYAPREAWLARYHADPNLNRPVQIQLPAASFELTDIQYDGSRKKANLTRELKVLTSDNARYTTTFTPAPWNFNFSLYLYTKNSDDAVQLLEQILPFFTPEWTHTVELVPSLGTKLDIPCILRSATSQDTYEGAMPQSRVLTWTLQFTMKGYLYGPTNTKGVIKKAKTNFMAALSDAATREERVVVYPGLLANGAPTTNAQATVALSAIAANSNYGVIQDVTFYTDGLTYNPAQDTDA